MIPGGKLPDNIKVLFNNTGKEMPETLDFVRDISTNWGVRVDWTERWVSIDESERKNKYKYDLEVVNYETASRKGEPFKRMIEVYKALPNPVNRYCSAQLKQKAVRHLGRQRF